MYVHDGCTIPTQCELPVTHLTVVPHLRIPLSSPSFPSSSLPPPPSSFPPQPSPSPLNNAYNQLAVCFLHTMETSSSCSPAHSFFPASLFPFSPSSFCSPSTSFPSFLPSTNTTLMCWSFVSKVVSDTLFSVYGGANQEASSTAHNQR